MVMHGRPSWCQNGATLVDELIELPTPNALELADDLLGDPDNPCLLGLRETGVVIDKPADLLLHRHIGVLSALPKGGQMVPCGLPLGRQFGELTYGVVPPILDPATSLGADHVERRPYK